jgi:hypothetical protein
MAEERDKYTQKLKTICDQSIRDDELYEHAIDALEREVDHQTQLKEQALTQFGELERQLAEQSEMPLSSS